MAGLGGTGGSGHVVHGLPGYVAAQTTRTPKSFPCRRVDAHSLLPGRRRAVGHAAGRRPELFTSYTACRDTSQRKRHGHRNRFRVGVWMRIHCFHCPLARQAAPSRGRVAAVVAMCVASAGLLVWFWAAPGEGQPDHPGARYTSSAHWRGRRLHRVAGSLPWWRCALRPRGCWCGSGHGAREVRVAHATARHAAWVAADDGPIRLTAGHPPSCSGRPSGCGRVADGSRCTGSAGRSRYSAARRLGGGRRRPDPADRRPPA